MSRLFNIPSMPQPTHHLMLVTPICLSRQFVPSPLPHLYVSNICSHTPLPSPSHCILFRLICFYFLPRFLNFLPLLRSVVTFSLLHAQVIACPNYSFTLSPIFLGPFFSKKKNYLFTTSKKYG